MKRETRNSVVIKDSEGNPVQFSTTHDHLRGRRGFVRVCVNHIATAPGELQLQTSYPEVEVELPMESMAVLRRVLPEWPW